MDSFFIKPGTAHTLSSNRANKSSVDSRINSAPSSSRGRGGGRGGMSSRGGRGGSFNGRCGSRGGGMSSRGGRGGSMSSRGGRGGSSFKGKERESASSDSNKYRDSKNNYKRKLSTEKDEYYDSDDDDNKEDQEKQSDEESEEEQPKSNINRINNNNNSRLNINKRTSKQESDEEESYDGENIPEFNSDDEDKFNSENESDDGRDIKKRLKLSVVEEEETADEKRVRLANEYLMKIRQTKQDLNLDEAVKNDLERSSGKYQYSYREQVSNLKFIENSSNITILKGHSSPITCVVLSDDQSIAYSASCDVIIKWDLINKSKLNKIKAFIPSKKNRKEFDQLKKNEKEEFKKTSYQGKILTMALSYDGKYLVTGGEEKLIKVWDTENMEVVETFKGHKDVISALTFRKGTYTLYSGSNDRTVKIWDLSQMAFVDTRYGHQSPITAMDSLSRERCISVSTDKTIRVWKIPEESQLIFRGHTGSIDCCALVAEDKFVTGSQEGSVALWNVNKKNATFIKNNAHNIINQIDDTPSNDLPWITSVAAIPNSDMVASGSCDGTIRLWSIMGGDKLKEVNTIPAIGFINDLKFSHDCSFLLAAVAQEHKFGRWKRIKEAKNSLLLINLKDQVDNNDLLIWDKKQKEKHEKEQQEQQQNGNINDNNNDEDLEDEEDDDNNEEAEEQKDE